MPATPKLYRIAVPPAALATLATKLAHATLPDALADGPAATDTQPDPRWELGTPLATVRRLAARWADGYDWRAHEAALNAELPQFVMRVAVEGFGAAGEGEEEEGLEVHFVHARAQVDGAVPLLFLHGWPGSFIEVRKLLPLLTRAEGGGPAFDVVAPSLPNFGFSEGVKQRGFGLKQYAEAMNNLMQTLGYTEYVTQGGDWGTFVSRAMCSLYPDAVKAAHLNLPVTLPPFPWRNPIIFLQSLSLVFSAAARAGFARTRLYQSSGSGYLALQDSKPQTIGYALADSPVALLAWMVEKLHDWTDGYGWTDDEMLTWVSIYQFSRAGPAASVRIYYESTHAPELTRADMLTRWIPRVPLGLAYLPKEIAVLPMAWGHQLGPVVQQTRYERGGHFASTEVPEALAADLRKMFGKGGAAFGVVTGRDGYRGSGGAAHVPDR